MFYLDGIPVELGMRKEAASVVKPRYGWAKQQLIGNIANRPKKFGNSKLATALATGLGSAGALAITMPIMNAVDKINKMDTNR